jgi:hypothetical protein
MHFLAHYYTELPSNNPLFVAALAIPDLTPRFTKIYNSLIVKHAPPTSSDLKQIHNGIVQHFTGDKRFHHSPLFLQHVSLAIQCFVNAGLSRERLRLSVIAHIAVEMMIDRQIILENQGICEEYYALLEKADEQVLNNYFALFSLQDEKRFFLRSFQFFKQRRFLFLFTNLENIVFGLNRVYGSVAKTEFTEPEKRKFLTALHNIDNQLRYSWQEILNDKL